MATWLPVLFSTVHVIASKLLPKYCQKRIHLIRSGSVQSPQITVTSRFFLLMQSRVRLRVPPLRPPSPSCGDGGGPDPFIAWAGYRDRLEECKDAFLCRCLVASECSSHPGVGCAPWCCSLAVWSTGCWVLMGCRSLRSSSSSLFSSSASACSCRLRRSAPNRARMSHITRDNWSWRETIIWFSKWTLSFSHFKNGGVALGLMCHLELLHLVLQLGLFLHHVSPLWVQARLHLSSHLLQLTQHLRPSANIQQDQSYNVQSYSSSVRRVPRRTGAAPPLCAALPHSCVVTDRWREACDRSRWDTLCCRSYILTSGPPNLASLSARDNLRGERPRETWCSIIQKGNWV